ncbi:MAG: hypothetical protein ACI9TV_000346 [Sulfurimonas sp.]|jgi:hypothetical protein|uniref:hypothetical protein n=1 Tax=Sulfurimonas sp. TaxID=2022749 RepID=UPI0039E65816
MKYINKKIIFTFLLVLLMNGCLGIIPNKDSVTRKDTTTNIESSIYKKYNRHTDTTYYSHNNLFGKNISIYWTKKKKEKSYARIKFSYLGSRWIFFNEVTLVNAAGSRISFHIKSTDISTNVVSDRIVSEKANFLLSKVDIISLKKLFNSPSVDLRLSGKSHKDYALSESEIKSLFEILSYNP